MCSLRRNWGVRSSQKTAVAEKDCCRVARDDPGVSGPSATWVGESLVSAHRVREVNLTGWLRIGFCPTLSRGVFFEVMNYLPATPPKAGGVRVFVVSASASVVSKAEDQLGRLPVASADPNPLWAEEGADEGEAEDLSARQLGGV